MISNSDGIGGKIQFGEFVEGFDDLEGIYRRAEISACCALAAGFCDQSCGGAALDGSLIQFTGVIARRRIINMEKPSNQCIRYYTPKTKPVSLSRTYTRVDTDFPARVCIINSSASRGVKIESFRFSGNSRLRRRA